MCVRNYNFEFIFISLMDLKLLKHEFENPKQTRLAIFVIDQFLSHIWINSLSLLFYFSFVVSLN